MPFTAVFIILATLSKKPFVSLALIVSVGVCASACGFGFLGIALTEFALNDDDLLDYKFVEKDLFNSST